MLDCAILIYLPVLASLTTVTLYNVFPTDQLPTATATFANEPSVTIIPTAIGKDGRTTYVYDIMGADYTYEGTFHPGVLVLSCILILDVFRYLDRGVRIC